MPSKACFLNLCIYSVTQGNACSHWLELNEVWLLSFTTEFRGSNNWSNFHCYYTPVTLVTQPIMNATVLHFINQHSSTSVLADLKRHPSGIFSFYALGATQTINNSGIYSV